MRAQAEHYAGNESVVAWQIDNEFGCHDTAVCYCDHCRAAFARWLERRYGSVDELNRAWGTVFWSQEYRDFDEVIVPAYTAVEQPGRFTHNPGLLLDYQRFSSDSIVAYQQAQIDLIREATDAPITHNFMGHFADIDYYDLARELDFVSWDNYPVDQWGAGTPSSIAMAHDITRGTKRRYLLGDGAALRTVRVGGLRCDAGARVRSDSGTTRESRTVRIRSCTFGGGRHCSGPSSTGTACSTTTALPAVATAR